MPLLGVVDKVLAVLNNLRTDFFLFLNYFLLGERKLQILVKAKQMCVRIGLKI